MTDNLHHTLHTWATSHGASLNISVEVRQDDHSGAGFRVKAGAEIHPGDHIVSCPTSLTLSYLNALPNPPPSFRKDPSSPPFPEEFLASAPPHVVGRFFLIQQYLLGQDSFWWPYIRSLPQPDRPSSLPLPPFWDEDDLELLRGTNLEVSVREIKATLDREFRDSKKALEGWGQRSEYTPRLYNWAYAIFTSRSFMPSLVIPRCDELKLPDGVRSWNDFSILMPLFDVGNHSITAKTSWGTVEGKGCNLVTRDGHSGGQEIFNNYGMKTNAQLLLAYGFVIPAREELHNDYIHIRKRVPPGSDGSDVDGSQKPPEYLFSLRPMTHPSSVLGRALQSESIAPEDVFPAFRLVQDAMILDIAEQVLQNNPALGPSSSSTTGESGLLRRILTIDLPPESSQLVNIIIATIQQKALQELEKLDESEVEVDEGQEADLEPCQRVALYYRRRCREVLEGVMESIEAAVEDERYVALMRGVTLER
ncbi:uncharacterized protein DNG_07962 [Cephalotrichum gorgonifer]|uniref:SET domain-containing protein n=1 Tax=Cephalotrichum gorgonifer TaxID=2041049 RepID=A0AAE8N5P5_9PEZI|nr:uncharacterized protein DNG_07962 [Cephalotrichum gorgonifer]